MGQMMKEAGAAAKNANVYSVCGGADRWHVFQHPGSVPVASFDDKAAALNYAMCLARGRVAWHLLLRQNGAPCESTTLANGNAHH
jgi:hypothetical protein